MSSEWGSGAGGGLDSDGWGGVSLGGGDVGGSGVAPETDGLKVVRNINADEIVKIVLVGSPGL